MQRKISTLILGLCVLAGACYAQTSSSQTDPQTADKKTNEPQTPQPPATPGPAVIPALVGFGVEDGTPVKLRLTRNLSSATDKTGDTVDFEVLDDVSVGGIIVIPRGGMAWATITEAHPKRRMGRGGRLDVNIDNVRLMDGEKAPLRAMKEGKGGGHVGAMTGAMVATSIVFFPAAPLFLFMHGKDINIPKGTEITAYVASNIPLDKAKFESIAAQGQTTPATAQPVAPTGQTTLSVTSTPASADIEVDGNFIGNTPSSCHVTPGEHAVKISKKGFKTWERKLTTSGGTVNVNAELEEEK